MKHLVRCLLTCSFLLLPLSGRAVAQETLENRELVGIVEEQAQLLRQLQRLRGTMDVLLQRLEAEGRTRTAELVRQALVKLDARSLEKEGDRPATTEERMERAREMLSDGRLVQALESQTALASMRQGARKPTLSIS